MEFIKNIFYGIAIGISNAIPGVSGGTMAVILNIYDKILFAVSLKNIKKNLNFLIPLGIGGVAGIFALSKVIVPMRDNFPMILGFCFMGLIIGSLPIIYRHGVTPGEKLKTKNVIVCCGCFGLMVAMSLMDQDALVNKTLEEMGGMNIQLCFFILLGSLISAIAMIVPGISGSLVMLLMGIYTVVIEAVSSLEITVLIPTAIGASIGLIIGIKVIKKFMRFHPQMLYFGILGLVAGSLWPVYPGFEFGLQGIIAIICGIFFGTIAFLTSRGK
ncbi:MAG: DUF368 domain-containing protein [Anaerovoracaceae bacterium]